jgi:hypothetical protein
VTQLTLKGDRNCEYGWAKTKLGQGPGTVLDLGSGHRGNLCRYAVRSGFDTIGIDIVEIMFAHPKLQTVLCDFLDWEYDGYFDWILSVSSVEHFGLAGRYYIEVNDPDADLRAMRKCRTFMQPHSKMIMTIPVGIDTVVAPYHRVYGRTRLPLLLNGYEILEKQYWAKVKGVDIYDGVTEGVALNEQPTIEDPRYYAIGGYVLRKSNE